MTRRQAEDLIEKRGFQIWAVHNMREFRAMDRWGINIFVNWEEDSFRIAWSIPKTILTLNCPECSPFSSQTQFEKMYFGFKKQVRKLKEDEGFDKDLFAFDFSNVKSFECRCGQKFVNTSPMLYKSESEKEDVNG